MRFPLNVLLVSSELGLSYSAHEGCIKTLIDNPAVRSYGFTDLQEETERVINEGKVNTVFIDPGTLPWDAAPFIVNVRSSSPKIVFVIYAGAACRARFCDAHPRFSKYFHLESFKYRYGTSAAELAEYQKQLDDVIKQCEHWHRESYPYDFAISFAGDQRAYAEKVAQALAAKSAKVFYDRNRLEQSGLLGADLVTKLHEIYSKDSRFCIMLISKSYVTKVWTIHERKAIQERLLLDRVDGYLIPIRIDDTSVPGLSAALAFGDISEGVEKISETLIQKVQIHGSEQNKKCFCDTRSRSLGRLDLFYQ